MDPTKKTTGGIQPLHKAVPSTENGKEQEGVASFATGQRSVKEQTHKPSDAKEAMKRSTSLQNATEWATLLSNAQSKAFIARMGYSKAGISIAERKNYIRRGIEGMKEIENLKPEERARYDNYDYNKDPAIKELKEKEEQMAVELEMAFKDLSALLETIKQGGKRVSFKNSSLQSSISNLDKSIEACEKVAKEANNIPQDAEAQSQVMEAMQNVQDAIEIVVKKVPTLEEINDGIEELEKNVKEPLTTATEDDLPAHQQRLEDETNLSLLKNLRDVLQSVQAKPAEGKVPSESIEQKSAQEKPAQGKVASESIEKQLAPTPEVESINTTLEKSIEKLQDLSKFEMISAVFGELINSMIDALKELYSKIVREKEKPIQLDIDIPLENLFKRVIKPDVQSKNTTDENKTSDAE